VIPQRWKSAARKDQPHPSNRQQVPGAFGAPWNGPGVYWPEVRPNPQLRALCSDHERGDRASGVPKGWVKFGVFDTDLLRKLYFAGSLKIARRIVAS
jgi:hypothetical protein